MNLKKGIDFVGVSVVYFCHDGKGNFVMAKRSKNARDEHGKWDIGAGAIEFGDTAQATLIKEIKEEYGTEVLSYEFLGYRDVLREQNGQKIHWETLDFKVLVDPKKVKNNEPHKFEEVKWFSKNTKPSFDLSHSQLAIFYTKYQDRLWN